MAPAKTVWFSKQSMHPGLQYNLRSVIISTVCVWKWVQNACLFSIQKLYINQISVHRWSLLWVCDYFNTMWGSMLLNWWGFYANTIVNRYLLRDPMVPFVRVREREETSHLTKVEGRWWSIFFILIGRTISFFEHLWFVKETPILMVF